MSAGLPRPASSIYSNSFELEDLVHRLSEQARFQEEYEIKALQIELDALKHQINDARSRWAFIYDIMMDSADLATKLSLICKDADAQVHRERNDDRERKKRLANRTVV